MEKDEIYAIIREKYPNFTMKYYENVILTQENLEKYGADVLHTLAETVDWEAQNILQEGLEILEELSFEELERRVKQEDTSIFSQEMQDFIQNKDGILQDYAYFSQNISENRDWGLLAYYQPSIHIKILQHVKANGAMENYKKVEEMAQTAKFLGFVPTSCLLLSDTAINLFSVETIARLSREIQGVVYEEPEKISIEEFDALFKDSPEKLAVLFLSDFQARIFGRPYDTPKKEREEITREEIDKLYEEYLEITTKFPQGALRVLHEISYREVYDQLVKANREGLLKDSSMIQNWNNLTAQMPDFVPLRWYMLSNEFAKKYSAQELSAFSEDNILFERLDKYGLPLLKLLSIEELQEPEETETPQQEIDPLDEIFGYGGEVVTQKPYSLEKFAEDLLNNDRIKELVSSFPSSKKGPCLGKVVNSLYNWYKSVAINNQNLQTPESLSEIEEILKKAKKFQEVAKFIPPFSVLQKYPEDQIEKFDSKKWKQLIEYDIYNQSTDAKNALIEAVLTLGVFETDENAQKRYSLLQKFATYIPREISVNENNLYDYINNAAWYVEGMLSENIELVSEEKIPGSMRYELSLGSLYNDPIIKKMCKGDEKLERQLLNWKLPNRMSPEQMKAVLQGRDESSQGETLGAEEKAIIQYIYEKGYEEVWDIQLHLRLKTNLRNLDAKTRDGLVRKIRYLYEGINVPDIMTASDMHAIFDGMDMQYKPGFYDFFVKNLGTILNDQKSQKMLAKIQNQWADIQEAFLGKEITFDMCASYLSTIEYENVRPQDAEIAKLSLNCQYNQDMFEKAVSLHQEQLKRTKSSIPAIWEDTSSKGYTYQVLRLDDPAAIFVGELTDCCQAINNVGESCMIHSATSQNGRVLVVKDTKGKIVSQSWIWRNKNVLCLDNVETVQRDHHHKRLISNEILNTIQRAAKQFIEVDKEQFERWSKTNLAELTKQRESGEISDQEFETKKAEIENIASSQRLTKVTVGSGYSDISLKGLKPDDENKTPEEAVSYISDSREQFILYEDVSEQSIERKPSTEKNIALYSDPEELKKLIHIDTSDLELPEGREEELEDEWVDDWENEWGDEQEDVWEEDGGFRDEYDDDYNVIIAKEEIERFARNFLNNKNRQEAQEFIAEIIRHLQRPIER